MSPIVSSDHVFLVSAQTSRGLQESEIPSQIFGTVVVRHFQGLVRILFSSQQLLDTGETELLESEGVLGHRSVEGRRGHHPHNHSVGNPELERIVAFEMLLISLHVEGSDLASDCRVAHRLTTVHAMHQFFVDGGIDSQLTEVQFHFDVGGLESSV